MSGTVVSKNLYELLGNTHDEDSDREPDPPVKVIDKAPPRTTKRNATGEAPAPKKSAPPVARGGHQGPAGNEGAFRDRNAGSTANRSKPTPEGGADRPPRSYAGRGRGGRGGNHNYDRHSRSVGGESEKQANHGWGANEGPAEFADEQAGDAIAKAEGKDAVTADAEGGAEVVAEAAEPEPEDTNISYADYLAQQAEKKLDLGTLEVRKPNEGTKQDKKWESAKVITKDEEEDFVAGSGGKAKRERERKQKQIVEIDQRFVEAPEQRGGRGGFRGGRGRGDGQARGRGDGFRGGRGGEGRGRGRGDGSFRGGRGQARGGAGGASINTDDTNAFPSLGS